MTRRLAGSLIAAAVMLAVPASANAGDVTLHPNGFGQHSYAAWKAKEGLADSSGGKDQALYFQKDTATDVFAAGVASFNGIGGFAPAGPTLHLEFWVRDDSHCGAGAPRFNVTFQNMPTAFVGCAGMTPGATQTAPNGHQYQQRSTEFPVPPGAAFGSLAIVFDEQGSAFLDDIRVDDMTWTSATDNGNG